MVKMALKDKIIKKFGVDDESQYSDVDLQYMSSLSSAVLQKSARSTQVLVWSILGLLFIGIIWMSFAEVDEQTKGIGKIIPSNQIQKIQNLEGGIVEQILCSEGQMVDVNQTLVKLSSTGFASTAAESKTRLNELRARVERLSAELDDKPYNPSPALLRDIPNIVRQEQAVYFTDVQQYVATVSVAKEQLRQAQSELNEAKAKKQQLELKYDLMNKEINITEPLVRKGLVASVEFLRLQRQAGDISQDLSAVNTSIPRIKSKIIEAGEKQKQSMLEFKNKVAKDLNDANSEMARLTHTQVGLEDKVERATIKSPVRGTIKKIYVNTVGGVIQPGSDIIEIVPSQDVLLAEVQVKPSDIAYIHVGDDAKIKITAYDFSIYGGLDGKVTWVSADTIKDDKGESHYLVRIKTDKTYLLGRDSKKLDIMVGMTVEADILTGRKTILSYLLKPILKARSSALTER
jgi:adhesin transport system membrane fusion protein